MKNLLVIVIIAALCSCSNQNTGEPGSLPYQETWESLKKFPKNPEFFLDAKFGIYTHWGPVTVATDHPDSEGGVQWYGRNMYNKDDPAFSYHQERFGDQKEFGYKELTKLFKGEKFDADEWAEIFASSGARFAGPVAIHHDNYAMWDSDVTPWNSVDQSPSIDFTAELSRAIKAKGMLYLTAFHHSFTWDYFNYAYEFDAADGSNKALYCEPHDELTPPSKEFLDNWLAIVDEVVENYEPDMIWFDFGLGKLIPDEYQIKMFANYYNWATEMDRDAVVFHKHEKIQRYTGVLDFERGRANKQTIYPWLTDTSLGPWFHDPSHPYYETNQLIDILVDIVSKNGSMLLNVGPRADGSIPEEAQKILSEMGDWLAVNGEGIFETRTWKVFGEGPTRMEKGGGFSENTTFNYSDQDIRFTRSKDGKTVYAFLLGWPESEELLISSFTYKNGFSKETINSVQLLGAEKSISFKATEKGISIDLPAEKPCEHAFCLKFNLK